MAWHGIAWHGIAWHNVAWHGSAGQQADGSARSRYEARIEACCVSQAAVVVNARGGGRIHCWEINGSVELGIK